MIFRLRPFVCLVLSALLVPLSTNAGILSFPQNPGFGEPSYSQAELDFAVARAKANGRLEAAAECLADPGNCGCSDGLAPCGVSTSSTLPDALYGETEPNDHIVAADPLVLSAKYWGQSQSLHDQDWFYLTTNEPNQVVMLNFTVPDRVLTSPDRLSQGWLISVKDAAGNDYAQFDTRFALDDPNTLDKNESKEITYPVFLGNQGTYYVVIEPRLADVAGNPITTTEGINLNDLSVLYSPYNLVAVLDYSLMDNPPPDVNFFDTETEPNDGWQTADPITTTVAMYGMLHSLLTGNAQVGWALQSEQDWFWYTSPGHEIVSFDFCQREACDATDGRAWRVTVQDRDGTVLTSFQTSGAKSVRFGIDQPGDYFIQITAELKYDSNGDLVQQCQQWSNPDPGQEATCLAYAPVAQVIDAQYNFTWLGTGLPPQTRN